MALLAGCSSTSDNGTPQSTGGESSSPAAGEAAEQPAPLIHVHGIARHPRTDDLLVATHQGLFHQVDGEFVRKGPAIDLMGFTIGDDGTLYASGHPAPGTDLPQPVGLITSQDTGRTWQVASLGGQSDFHALTAGPNGAIGFDGTLRHTEDTKTWDTRDIPSPPRVLAASPTSGKILATTSAGLLMSHDEGTTWTSLAPPQTAVLAAWADEETIVVSSAEGRLATSSDAGQTWTLHPTSIGPAEALWAGRTTDGQLEIIASVDGRVISTTDAGRTTQTLVQ
ncbi:hypothetical protein O9K63_02575 [Janibacter cremeus]|uniref:F510_1955 family glycosylhydrolase n=1 Tax=Janibacter cremeus TaxID=1285192 RepID=UPI0023F96EE2|nr:hypothetical protein [Janibacter cremeus]WEV78699.1 hypothetical protein O9K63_02575 [Janibacter cremeus]